MSRSPIEGIATERTSFAVWKSPRSSFHPNVTSSRPTAREDVEGEADRVGAGGRNAGAEELETRKAERTEDEQEAHHGLRAHDEDRDDHRRARVPMSAERALVHERGAIEEHRAGEDPKVRHRDFDHRRFRVEELEQEARRDEHQREEHGGDRHRDHDRRSENAPSSLRVSGAAGSRDERDAPDAHRLNQRLDEVRALRRVAPGRHGLPAEPADQCNVDHVDDVDDAQGQHRRPRHRPDVAIEPLIARDRRRGGPTVVDRARHSRRRNVAPSPLNGWTPPCSQPVQLYFQRRRTRPADDRGGPGWCRVFETSPAQTRSASYRAHPRLQTPCFMEFSVTV